MSAIDQEKFAS